MYEISNEKLDEIRKGGILVLVPSYGGQNFTAFAKSMIGLAKVCTHYQIPMDVFIISNESLIPRARNYCADVFLNQTYKIMVDGVEEERHFQHGIFIDTDIEFNPVDVIVMAHLQNENPDYDVICGPYQKKVVSWEKIKRAVERGFADNNPNDLEHYVGDFVFNVVGDKPAMTNAPFEVHESGTGFMMFRRETLLKLKDAYPELTYIPDHGRSQDWDGSREIHAFFDTMIEPKTKRYLSEDYYFCKLVREAGMKVWLVPFFELKHHGYFVYSGSLGHIAQAGLSATVDPKELKKRKK